MANPFYVDPTGGFNTGAQIAGLGQALLGATQAREQRAMREQEMLAQQEAKQRQEAGMQAFREAQGDPSKIANLMMEYPEFGQMAQEQFKFTNEQTRPAVEQTYASILSNPQNAEQYLMRGIEQVRSLGGNPTNMVNDLRNFQENPEEALKNIELGVAAVAPQVYKAYESQKKQIADAARGPDIPSGTREFNDLLEKAASGDETTRRAARIKLGLDPRSTGSAALTITELGNAEEVAQTEEQLAAGREGGKLAAQLKLSPKVKGAVETASRAAAKLADDAIEAGSNQATFDVYDVGMRGVAEALGNTSTGPFVGRLPAITSEQQIAEGTIAAMAPVLKQMFRAAGEGAFTDYDQKLLLDMMPTRKDTPEAIQAKLSNIDSIVRSKLGITNSGQSQQPSPQTNTVNWADLQ